MSVSAEARKAVLRRYAQAHDELAEIAQELVGVGENDAAEVAHDRALLVLMAYQTEMDEPLRPDELPEPAPDPRPPWMVRRVGP